MMPSGPPCTLMVLIGASVFESHIAMGLLEANPWPDLGSTATPRALVLAISPAGSSVSRSKTATWPTRVAEREQRERFVPIPPSIQLAAGDIAYNRSGKLQLFVLGAGPEVIERYRLRDLRQRFQALSDGIRRVQARRHDFDRIGSGLRVLPELEEGRDRSDFRIS